MILDDSDVSSMFIKVLVGYFGKGINYVVVDGGVFTGR